MLVVGVIAVILVFMYSQGYLGGQMVRTNVQFDQKPSSFQRMVQSVSPKTQPGPPKVQTGAQKKQK